MSPPRLGFSWFIPADPIGAAKTWAHGQSPRGLAEQHESPLETAMREFEEETGVKPQPPFLELTPLRQKSGKSVHCWAFEGEAQASYAPGSSTFQIEWPPKSKRQAVFPEVDEIRLFEIDEALSKILPGQAGFIRELEQRLR